MTTQPHPLLADLIAHLDRGPTEADTARIVAALGGPRLDPADLVAMRLYPEYLPQVHELGFTTTQRLLHFLWETLDGLPLGVATNLAIGFRRAVGERLFAACGKNFICEIGVRFNYGHNLTVGDDVFFNRGVFLDTKGGVTIGDSVGLAEDVQIFTHSHSEARHTERSYAPVTIQDHATVYAGAMILPGVTIGEEAIVAGRAVVNQDVEPGILVAGVPAKPMRARDSDGNHGADLEHIWLDRAAFQDD